MEQKTCAWKYCRGTTVGQNCKVKPMEGREYCSKHTSRVAAKKPRQPAATRLETDEVFGKPAAESAEPTPRNKFSVFNFTFSTNRDVEKLSTAEKLAFKAAIDQLFDPASASIMEYLLDSKSDNPTANIISSRTLFRYEVGSEQHRLHAHCQLLLEHRGHYRIDAPKLRETLKSQIGYPVYTKVDAQTDHAAAYAAYITKQDAAVPYDFDGAATTPTIAQPTPTYAPSPASSPGIPIAEFTSAPIQPAVTGRRASELVVLPAPTRRTAPVAAPTRAGVNGSAQKTRSASSVLAKYQFRQLRALGYDSIKL